MPSAFSKFDLVENIEFTLTDKDGKCKKLFQPFAPFAWVISHFGVQVPQCFPFGTWQNSLKVANLIPTVGKAGIAARINAVGTPAAFTYLALGITNTAADPADTTLASEIVDSGLERAAATCTVTTITTTDDTAQLAHTWTASGAKGLVETGVFNDPTTGTLLARSIFAIVNVAIGDSFTMTYKVKVA